MLAVRYSDKKIESRKGKLVMRTTACFAAFALAAAFMAVPLRADISVSRPVSPDGDSLQDIFDAVSSPSINVIDDQFDKAVFTNSGTGSALFAVVAKAGDRSGNSQFGIYNYLSPTTKVVIFDSTDGIQSGVSDMARVSFKANGDIAVLTASGSTVVTSGFGVHKFGFYIDVLDDNDVVLETLYSEDSRNGGDARALIFRGDNAGSFQTPGSLAGTFTDSEFVIAFDDGREDAATGVHPDDFADFVVISQSVVPVPEPSSIVLAAFCLLTLLGLPVRRRRR